MAELLINRGGSRCDVSSWEKDNVVSKNDEKIKLSDRLTRIVLLLFFIRVFLLKFHLKI
jgi:hypothetical protein